MAISGSAKAITPARSNLARSGATRSGWPLVVGRPAWLYALSNIARSGATRSNYTSGRGFVRIGGIHVGTIPTSPTDKVLGGVTITDALNDQPTRCTFRVRGLIPAIGADVIYTIGSKNNGDRLFAGQVLTTSQGYVGTPANYWHDVAAIDWTWGVNQRLVARRWTGTSATTIATELVAAGAPGYGVAGIAAGLPVLDEFTTTNEEVSTALTALARRIGGYWYVDYDRQVHLFTGQEAGQTLPTPINPIHPTLTNLVIDRDGSQLVTRVYIEAGGAVALGDVRAGDTMIPVATVSWYDASGGVVVSGPQRITYGGVMTGGGGSLVGPGAAPVVAPVGVVIAGAGIEAGEHAYAVSFVTATGESLAGPRLALTVGVIAAPTTPPTIGSQLFGAGPDPGAHTWVVTFVTASGETTAGPGASVTIDPAPVPLSAPTPGTPGFGGAMAQGSYSYAVTFVTPSGESTIGPQSPPVTMIATSLAPPSVGVPGTAILGGNIIPGSYAYAVVFETADGGMTTAGPTGPWIDMVYTKLAPPPTAPTVVINGSGGLTGGVAYQWACTFMTANGGETTYGALSDWITCPGASGVATLTNLPIGPAGTTARRIYRTTSGSNLRLVGTLTDNTTTTHTDGQQTGALGGPPPATNTTQGPITTAVALTDIPKGPTGIVARRLYRSASGDSLQLLTRIADNTTTTYTDTARSADGGSPPATNTTVGTWTSSVPLTGIPVGPAGTSSRRLYRSGGGPNQLVTTINNNSTTTYTDTAATGSLGAAPPAVNLAGQRQVQLSKIPTGGPDVTARRVYRTRANQTPYALTLTLNDNTTTTATDTTPDAGLGAAPPDTSTALAARVQLTSVPTGPTGVTQRKIYRTKAGLSALQLLTTIANNTTTTYTDAAADATLGAAPPGADLSGLSQPSGSVNAGATTLIVAGAGAFPASGGWAVVGNGQQVIRYTGVSGNTLTGIPASGDGSITASIAYNSTVTVAPALTGIPASGAGAILYRITEGQDVNLWIQVDDIAAQQAVALLFTSAAGGAHSGIIEDVIQDRRLSATEARARGRAHLQQRRSLQIRIRYQSRDINSRSGRLVTVNLLSPPYAISSTFMIQTVRIQHTTPDLGPTFDVDASSERFSFEDLLRRWRDTPEG